MKLTGSARTSAGRRPHNEDTHLVRDDLGVWVVADGMGGHDGGEVASDLAVDVVHGFFERIGAHDLGFDRHLDERRTVAESLVDMAVRLAHREVRRERVGPLSRMSTTLAILLARGHDAVVAHVGDSRIYRLRGGHLERLTRDHSLRAELEEVASARELAPAFGHVVTRSVGMDASFDPDVKSLRVRPGDTFLLCTDGITDALEDRRIGRVLAEGDGAVACESLLHEALAAGARDNLTAVVVQAV